METPEQKRKRQFDYMMSAFLKEREERMLAGVHFSAWGNFVFIISAAITLSQAILATVAQANLDSNYLQSISNVTIAVVAAFSVFWQSLVKHWDYPGQAALHNSAASALEKLYNVALLRAREEAANVYGKQDCHHSQHDGTGGDGNDDEEEEEKSFEGNGSTGTVTLTKQFEQAIEGCKSNVPVKIAAAFETLDARITMSNRSLVVGRRDYKKTEIAWERVYPGLYRQLTTEIITQPGWPYFLPNPEKVVNKTMEKFQKLDACLLKSLLDRNEEIHQIRKSHNAFGPKQQYDATSESKQQDEATESTPFMA